MYVRFSYWARRPRSSKRLVLIERIVQFVTITGKLYQIGRDMQVNFLDADYADFTVFFHHRLHRLCFDEAVFNGLFIQRLKPPVRYTCRAGSQPQSAVPLGLSSKLLTLIFLDAD